MAGHSPMLIVLAISAAAAFMLLAVASSWAIAASAAIIDIPLAVGIAGGVSIMATVSFGTIYVAVASAFSVVGPLLPAYVRVNQPKPAAEVLNTPRWPPTR
jgi:hypothetical protein